MSTRKEQIQDRVAHWYPLEINSDDPDVLSKNLGLRTAYKTGADEVFHLTADQWEAQRNETAREIRCQIDHNILDVDVHLTSLRQADAAMTALGFKRAEEPTS